MLILETFIDKTRNVRFGESEPHEPFTDDLGKLFRALRSEYGRCTSKVYVTTATEEAVPIGWVFEKSLCYEDCRRCQGYREHQHQRYTREVWVCCKAEPDEHVVTLGRAFRIDTKQPLEERVS